MSALQGMAICRRLEGQRRIPGAIIGPCRACKVLLQMSPEIARRADAGELAALCRSCGLGIAEHLEAKGKPVEVLATPKALAALDDPRSDPVAVEYFKKRLLRCAHCGAMVASSEAATHVCEKREKP